MASSHELFGRLLYNRSRYTLKRRVSELLRKWLGLLRYLSNVALYGKHNISKLPCTIPKVEFLVTQAVANLKILRLVLISEQGKSGEQW